LSLLFFLLLALLSTLFEFDALASNALRILLFPLLEWHQSLLETLLNIYVNVILIRLLASEVWEKLNDRRVRCNLLTGQQRIDVEEALHTACTIGPR